VEAKKDERNEGYGTEIKKKEKRRKQRKGWGR